MTFRSVCCAASWAALALLVSSAVSDAGARARPMTGQQVPAGQSAPAPIGIAYEVRFEGVDGDLADLLAQVSDLMSKRGTPPATVAALRRRARDDAERLGKALRSEGYYTGTITPRLTRKEGGFDVVLVVETGPQATVSSLTVSYIDRAEDVGEEMSALPQSAGDLGIALGTPARGSAIVDMTSQAVAYLRNHGHPRARLERRTVTLLAKTAELKIDLHVSAGPRQTFGELTIGGLESVDEAYARELVQWQPGAIYNQSEIASARSRLRKSGLFDGIEFKPADTSPPGSVPVHLVLAERPHRSIGAGARWSSDQGFGVRGLWEHRNLLGAAESLRLTLSIAEIEQSLKSEFRKPRFAHPDQTLLATFELAREETTAYDEDRAKAGLGLERRLSDPLRVSGAVNFEWSRSRDAGISETSQLLSLPLTGIWDRTDDLLDPSKGERAGLTVTPFAGRSGTAVYFLRAEATASHYLTLDAFPDTTLATRARLGTIFADQLADIPSSIRFYAGGGGSLRGYAFQEAGPLDAAGDPVGGRSVVELGAEVRHRFTETMGAVAFLDAGNVDTKSTPNFSDRPLMSAGVGGRYYTAVGPVRADIAFPLEKRPGDDSFQIYLSLGQAF